MTLKFSITAEVTEDQLFKIISLIGTDVSVRLAGVAPPVAKPATEPPPADLRDRVLAAIPENKPIHRLKIHKLFPKVASTTIDGQLSRMTQKKLIERVGEPGNYQRVPQRIFGELPQRRRQRAVKWILAAALMGWSGTAWAADEATCARYGGTVERFVMLATGDDIDLAQAVRGAAEAHCFVVDFPPLEISIDDPIDDAFGTPPAEVASAAKPPTAKAPSTWEKKCRRYYGSFRVADGTVLRRGSKTRSRCPL